MNECSKACKSDEFFDIKNCSCEHQIGKLVLECEDETLNTTRILLNNKN